jgi:flavin reductase (DIM6/NTAB) family NADH-FMN oxidoreductase RutF
VLNLVDPSMVAAIDRIALTTGRRDIVEYKRDRGFRYEPDKFAVSGLTAEPCDLVQPWAVRESPIQIEARVVSIRPIDGGAAQAIEVELLRTHVDDSLLVIDKPHYINPLLWDPLIMKFTEYFGGGAVAHRSSLAAAWQMPPLGI